MTEWVGVVVLAVLTAAAIALGTRGHHNHDRHRY